VRDAKSPVAEPTPVAACSGSCRGLVARGALVALLAASTLLALNAGEALAVEYGHTVVTGEYGNTGSGTETGDGCLIAYQSAEDKLYFMGDESLYGLNWNGVGSVTPITGNFPITGVTNARCYEGEPGFTVDQTNGNLYQTGVYAPHLFGWNSLGEPIEGFPVTFENTEATCDIATTNTGEPWVGAYGQPAFVHKSSSTGGEFGTIELTQGSACKIAIDQTNNDLYAAGTFTHHYIQQYSAANGYSPTSLTLPLPPNTLRVDFTINSATHTLYVPFEDKVNAYDTVTGELKEEIEFGGTTISVAVDEDTDTLFVHDREHQVIKELPKGIVPKAVTGDPTGNLTVSGTADPNGAGDIVECFFEYGSEAGHYTGIQSCDQSTPISGETPVTATLPIPFEQDTHYRLVVKTATLGGVRKGADKVITPHAVEGLTTEAATGITRLSATIHGSFAGNGEANEYKFQWGTSAGYGSETEWLDGGSATAPPRSAFQLLLSSLQPETTYHFHILARNAKGTSDGGDLTFQTLPPVQSLTAEAATDVGPRTATLTGSFVGDGDHTTYHFKYGTNGSFYPFETAVTDVGSPTVQTPLSAPISGLELETTYHYKIVATNGLGTTESNDMTFTSRPAVEGVKTLSATGVSQDGLTFNGEYLGNGHDVRWHFEWGPTTAYGNETPDEDGGTAAGVQPVSATITNFLAYTTYHYRLVAEDTDPSVNGVTHGPDMTVTSEPALLPGMSGTRAVSVTPTSAVLEAELNPNRWPTAYRFEYGTNQDYDEATEVNGPIGSDMSFHTVSETVTNLLPGTLYHYRVSAINFSGIIYGPDQVFFTPGPPRIDSISASSVGQTTAHVTASIAPNAAATSAHFEYGTGSNASSSAQLPVGTDTSSHGIAADLSGLAPGTTYHFRVVGTNFVGTTSSTDQTFTTAPAPAVKEPKPPKCKRGFVRRNGKCVRRKHRNHRKHGNSHRGGGSHG
jgi:hypothetical protein